MSTQQFLRDGQWLTLEQIKKYNEAKSIKHDGVEVGDVVDLPLVDEKPKTKKTKNK